MDRSPPLAASLPSAFQGRLLIALAAVLWSLSGGFTKLLTQETPFQLATPPVSGLQIAFYRVLFAGLVLVPALRRRDISFRGLMLGMAGCFAVMNLSFVWATAEGTAANAVLLQYTAPMWMYLLSVWWLGEPADRRSSVALLLGLLGIAIIIWGGWQEAQLRVVAIALTSGVAYAGVVLGLRALRQASARWLTVLNHLASALALIPLLCYVWPPAPGGDQLAVLVLFGTVQMALPYWLMARGLRAVSPQEAGTITLLEPVLNPVWAYLVAPETERPSVFTLTGGAFILGALAWRYWPLRPHEKLPEQG
ncbi:MAG: DMT family transporter [Gemmataceae bacterium]|nr:DMT family transporter [Gemmataceae bacterium]